jgi:MFS family permease
MINDISEDLDTTVKGVQTVITLFLLIMAILMIPASKLTDRWGRKRCFIGGLILYRTAIIFSVARSPIPCQRTRSVPSMRSGPFYRRSGCSSWCSGSSRPAATTCS